MEGRWMDGTNDGMTERRIEGTNGGMKEGSKECCCTVWSRTECECQFHTVPDVKSVVSENLIEGLSKELPKPTRTATKVGASPLAMVPRQDQFGKLNDNSRMKRSGYMTPDSVTTAKVRLYQVNLLPRYVRLISLEIHHIRPAIKSVMRVFMQVFNRRKSNQM